MEGVEKAESEMTDPQRRALRFLVKHGGLWEVNPYVRSSTLIVLHDRGVLDMVRRVDPLTNVELRFFTINPAGEKLLPSQE